MLKVIFQSIHFQAVLALGLIISSRLSGGETYYTDFENFTVGDNTIIGTESWTGTHSTLKLHGIVSETEHGIAGIGKAAVIGGNYGTILSTSKYVYLWRPVNIDPVALNQEVATFSMVFGIKDSSSASSFRRDNFEVMIYNQSGTTIGALQFDNKTLDSSNQPYRSIYRTEWNGSSLTYKNTGYTFLPQTLETLEIRVNFRTNRWTASLGGVPLFQDLVFYSPASTQNLGSFRVRMIVSNPSTVTTYLQPGDNYLLFDDYTVRTDALTTELEMSRTSSGAAKLTWNEEAGVTYQVEYSSDCKTWNSNLVNSKHTAALTGTANFTDPTTPIPARRFYRVKRSFP